MPKEFWALLVLAVGVFVALHLEWRRHRRALRRLSVRIHVNGTRGKSSVTRLIAAALQEAGVPTMAKTTGTSARLIHPDGTEHLVPRDGRPKIGELIWAMNRALRLGAEAVVFECMAVDPDLQWVAENRMVDPTITVVTNARLDHTDAQGQSAVDIAAAFPVKRGGVLVTSDPLVASVKEEWLRSTGGEVHVASEDDVTMEELAGMAYVEHPENVAVALEVARLCGIPREVAIEGIEAAPPDPGVASVIDVPDPAGHWTLVNLFAANDPESSLRALGTVRQMFELPGRPVVLFVSRADRPARGAEFSVALAEQAELFTKVVLYGEKTRAVARKLRAAGLGPERIVDAGSRRPEALTELLLVEMDGARAVVGLGNIVGPAHRWLTHLGEVLERSPESPADTEDGTRSLERTWA